MATFDDLSAELVALISTHLDRNTFCSFRLARRDVHERTEKEFERRVCEQAWPLAPYSLNVLRDICNDSKLVKKLQHLRIGTQVFHKERVNEQLRKDFAGTNVSSAPHTHKLLEYVNAHAIFSQGDVFAMLAMIIDKIPVLNVVEVGDWYSNTQCPYYYHGLTTVRNELGRDFFVPAGVAHNEKTPVANGCTHAFIATMMALAMTRKPVKRLRAGQWNVASIDGVNLRYGLILRYIEIAYLPDLPSYRAEGLRASFDTLRSLDIAVAFVGIGDSPHTLYKENWLYYFCNLATNLQHLTITGDGWFRWRYTTIEGVPPTPCGPFVRGMSVFFHGLMLKHLTHFTLQNVAIDPVIFHGYFMERHTSTLSHLELRKVAMHGYGWEQYFRQVNKMLSRSGGSYKVSWLEQWYSCTDENSPEDPCRIVVFDNDGLDSCVRCRGKFDVGYNVFNPVDCAHTSKTFTWDETDDIKMSTRGCLELGRVWKGDPKYGVN